MPDDRFCILHLLSSLQCMFNQKIHWSLLVPSIGIVGGFVVAGPLSISTERLAPVNLIRELMAFATSLGTGVRFVQSD